MRSSLKYIIILMAIAMPSILHAQVNTKANLGDIYSASLKGNTKQYERAFFNLFPDTFTDFQRMYGYDEAKGGAIYYRQALGHINYFFKTAKSVDEKVFAQKLLSITKNGTWEADAENYFQSDLRNYFFGHSSLLIPLLKAKSQNEIDRFWYFFLDGPHFNKDTYNRTLILLKGNPSMVKACKRAADKVNKNNVH
ncbi:hypothetical protein EWM62_02640 [Mucilaginibacter terrigena]|uniref:DUF4919 domain-containing protein n=1 Tax=Mucilaginibacter terrigena TaxID=2492395 RepID=A0A4Q5LS55_9SPHI|nr:hypothetical protein [Mucilaginibacter terrigena]RYU92352.1 hypothetical protein EWM62_02640 [Mucilaginibacter terrigena]